MKRHTIYCRNNEHMQISSSQEQAIRHAQGPAMVLAGPGSGKTLVITRRVRALITECGADPGSILVITFTKAAAGQMRQRFFSMMGDDSLPGVIFGTFHAVFFQILKAAYHYTGEQILREEKRLQILEELAGRFGTTSGDMRELLRDLTAEITRVKNEQIPLEHFYSSTLAEDVFRSIFMGYQDRLRSEGLLDFDDMLVYTAQLLRQREDILRAWQKRFRYILVDEFQDINALQFETLRMLAAPENNLFVVGDDDQSVYRFRGAKPEIMLGFQRYYPDAVILRLEDNYRCAAPILRDAALVIAQNRTRFRKKAVSRSTQEGSVCLKLLGGVSEQARYIVEGIRRSYREGTAYREMAVLTRTNIGGRYLAERLMEYQIPFVMKDAMPCLYDHWIAKDLFAYIRLALGSRERRDLLQVMNRPVRYISREALEMPRFTFEQLYDWYEEKPYMQERIAQLEEDLDRIGSMQPFAAVNYIRYGAGYDDYLAQFAREHRLPVEELEEIAGELQEQAKGFASFSEWSEHIEKYREELEKQNRKKREKNEAEDAVVLSTLHGAKGLEFDEVFLPDLNEGVMPWHRAVLEADVEEERRLLYVGMTRAKRRLHLLYLKEKYGKAQTPSRFLRPLLS